MLKKARAERMAAEARAQSEEYSSRMKGLAFGAQVQGTMTVLPDSFDSLKDARAPAAAFERCRRMRPPPAGTFFSPSSPSFSLSREEGEPLSKKEQESFFKHPSKEEKEQSLLKKGVGDH